MSKSFGEVFPFEVFNTNEIYRTTFFPKVIINNTFNLFENTGIYFTSKAYAFRSKYKDRLISTFLEDLLKEYGIDSFISNTNSNMAISDIICNVLKQKFETKWNKLLELEDSNYDVLKPFNITLSETTKDKLKTLQDSANRVVNLTDKTDYETLKDKSDTTENNKTHGFNSLTGVPTDDSQSVVENEFKSTNTDTRNGSTTDTRNYERDIDTSRDYTRIGNIGNTSLSQLIVEEREKLRFIIIDEIYNDIASVLCRGKYI